jgi:hypothetical protein
MTTELFKDLRVISVVSNETRYNTDAVSTWRSAFRECVKLTIRLHNNPSDWRTRDLLKAWQDRDYNRPYSAEATRAALEAEQWVNDIYEQDGPLDQLLYINDREWLRSQYDERA